MKEDIIFILPNSTNTQTVKEVLRDNQLSIPIYESFMDDAVALAREKIAQGTKVIISRGNSIPLLKAAFTVPIVEIRYSFLDFALAVQKAMQKSQHIALVGYNDSYNCTELLQFFHPEQLELWRSARSEENTRAARGASIPRHRPYHLRTAHHV